MLKNRSIFFSHFLLKSRPSGLLVVLLIGLTAVFPTWEAIACTRIFWNNNDQAKVAARTMDLYVSENPQMQVNPRGINRYGMAGENSLHWIAKYGSISITGFGDPNVVSDGMNEKGLAAHALYLDKTQYERRDSRPGVSNLLWAQYILDNFATVDEAVASLKSFQLVSRQVAGREWPAHLAIEDATGNSLIVEYVNGEMVIHKGSQYTVMTNEPPLDEQLANLKQYKLFGGNLALPGDIDPQSRFVRAASFLKMLAQPKDNIEALARVYQVAQTVVNPSGAYDTKEDSSALDVWPTRWTSAADLTNKVFYFRSSESPNVFWVELRNIDFCKTNRSVSTLDPSNPALVGDVSGAFK